MRAPKIAGFASLFLLNHKNVIQNTFKSILLCTMKLLLLALMAATGKHVDSPRIP